MNWYAYAYNNPLKYVDPTGLFAFDEDSATGTVEQGETLSGICLKYYGDESESLYSVIAAINEIDDPDIIGVGDTIVLPPLLDINSRRYTRAGFFYDGVSETPEVFIATMVATPIVLRGLSALGITGVAEAAKSDIREIQRVARELGMSDLLRRQFGDWVEKSKHWDGLPKAYQYPIDVTLRRLRPLKGGLSALFFAS